MPSYLFLADLYSAFLAEIWTTGRVIRLNGYISCKDSKDLKH